MTGVIEKRSGGINGVTHVEDRPSAAVRGGGQRCHEALHLVMELNLQAGDVGEAGRRSVDPHLHGRVEGRDASLGRHLKAVCSTPGVGVGFDPR